MEMVLIKQYVICISVILKSLNDFFIVWLIG